MNNPITVLIAEDEESDYLLLEWALRKTNRAVNIHWVRNGVDAIRYLKGEGDFADRSRFPVPQVIILDLKMPGATGIEVLGWIRENPRYRVIPTLVMSSSHQQEDVKQAYALGANTYFVKPTSFDTLVDLCDKITSYWDYGVKPNIPS
jgi:CheY-like chemotaxis protein